MNLLKKKRDCILVSFICILLIVVLELYGVNFHDVIIESSRRSSQNYGLQKRGDHIKDIMKVVSTKVNVLIWQLRKNDLYWSSSTGGKVIFIQGDSFSPKSEQVLNDRMIQEHRTYQVHYNTISVKSLLKYFKQPEKWHEFDLCDQLPDTVKQTHWHVIMVQASLSECCGKGQERYQAIFTSWKLANIGTHIFVDGFECAFEQEFSINIFGKPQKMIKGQLSSAFLKDNEQAHFIVNQKNVFKPLTDGTKIGCAIKSYKNESVIYNWLDRNPKDILDNNNNATYNWSLVVAVNDGFFDFFNNWRLHFSKLNISLPVYVIAEDDVVYSKLINIKTSGMIIQRSEHISIKSSVKYSSDAFKKMMSARPSYILSFIQKGMDIIFSDLDTVWLKSPLPYLTGNFDIWSQLDYEPLHVYCAGFMAIKSNKDTYSLVKKWHNVLKVNPMLNQPAFNKLLKHSPLKVKTLDTKRFPSGKLYFENFTAEERAGVVVVHNNWIVGHEKKLKRFKKMNLWLNDSTS